MSIDRSAVPAPRPLPASPYEFPDPRHERSFNTIVAQGGDFRPETVLTAYRLGLFPWPHPNEEYLWFSPHPRAVLPPDGLHISRRLGRTIRSGRFAISVDRAFGAVMHACTERQEDGTWITPSIIDGYTALHEAGHAHSIEVWDSASGKLAGGLYGVATGSMFGAESMFFRVRDASKVAMAVLAHLAHEIGITLIDVQVVTDHTARMGAVEIDRRDYLRRLDAALAAEIDWRG